MLRSINPNLVEITWIYAWSHFGIVRPFWLYSHMNIFPVDAVSLHSEKKKKKKTFEYWVPSNKCLLKLSLISWAEVPSWRESPGSGDDFIVLLCGR